MGIRIYNKSSLTIDEQILRLREQGMLIADEKAAKKILSEVSYFRLTAYWRPMEEDKQNIVLRHGGEGYLVEGSCTIYDFLRHFGLEDIMRDFEYTTVAGLILDKSGHIPTTGEIVEWEKFIFEVVDMDGPRVDKVIVKNKLANQYEEDNYVE